MKKLLLKYCTSTSVVALLCILVWMSSCTENPFDCDPIASEQSPLMISTRALSEGTNVENALRTLRLVIFQSDGALLVNNKYNTADAGSQPPTGTYDYFLKTGDSYLFSKMLPKVSIRVYLVANEMRSLDGIRSEEEIEKARLNYNTRYTNEQGAMDIVIDNQPTADYPNRGYIPMYAKSGLLTPHQWSTSNQQEVQMPLVRALAKVVLQLKSGTMTEGALTHPDDKLTVNSASLMHVPTSCLLGDPSMVYDETLVSAATRNFVTPLVITNSTGADQTSDQLTFYLPEYIISQAGVDAKEYTYVQINATYHSGDTGEDIHSTYRIPIGDGVDKLYPGNRDVSTLTRADLTVSRNSLYNIEATVTTKGKLEIYQIETKITDWADPIGIDGDINTPVLNVTSTQVNMSAQTVKVHFWTNQSMPYIEESGTEGTGQTAIKVNELFNDLHADPGISTTHFKLFADAENNYLPYNGYIEFQFKEEGHYIVNQVYTVTLCAGKLKRVLTVIGNPVVGEVIFMANGGIGADFKQELQYSDTKGVELAGATVLLEGPTNFTPPTAESTLLGWSDAMSGAFMPKDETSDKYKITLSGYITRLNAWWE